MKIEALVKEKHSGMKVMAVTTTLKIYTSFSGIITESVHCVLSTCQILHQLLYALYLSTPYNLRT